jgi:hypothetical protein
VAKTEQAWIGAGVEVAADRRRTWVALAGVARGRAVVQLEDPLAGTLVTPALVQMWETWDLEWFAVDPRSPSATLLGPLREQGMPLKVADTVDIQVAHGGFVDLLANDRLRIRGHRALDECVRVAETRRLAGSVAIDRYGASEDMGPLLAAELAAWALGDPETAEGIEPGAWVL